MKNNGTDLNSGSCVLREATVLVVFGRREKHRAINDCIAEQVDLDSKMSLNSKTRNTQVCR